jgi:hypothetical protein
MTAAFLIAIGVLYVALHYMVRGVDVKRAREQDREDFYDEAVEMAEAINLPENFRP